METSSEAIVHADMVRTERGRIITTLIDQLDSLSEAGAAAIFAETPAYSAWRDESPARTDERVRDLREQTRLHYRTLLLALLEERSVTLEDIDFVRAAAMRRARGGIAVEHYMTAFRVGQQQLWDAIVSTGGRTSVGRDAALSLATPLLKYTHFASTHSASAYAEWQQSALADADRERRDLLELLLDGRLPSEGPFEAAARAYGIGRQERMLVVAAVPVDAEGGLDSMHASSSAIAHATQGATKTLVVLRYDEIVAVPVLPAGGDPSGLCERLAATQQRLRSERMPLAIGASTVAAGIDDLPHAYHEARLALDTLGGDEGFVALSQLTPMDYFILRSDETARRLVDPRLRTFLTEDRARGGPLRDTIEAFAQANMKLGAAAKRLHVHPHTAQYRLRRIEERSGRNPRKIDDLLELLIAIGLDRPDASNQAG